ADLRHHRLTLLLAAAAATSALALPSAAGAATVPAPPAAAAATTAPRPAEPEDLSDGLRVVGSTTYTVDLPASVVRVEHTATLTNEAPDTVRDGYVEQHYFPSYAVPVLVGATSIAAESEGRGSLRVDVEEGDGVFYGWAVVDLAPDLWFGATQTIRLSYEVPAQPPRSGTAVQVNSAFATFPVLPDGDPGLTSITVMTPDAVDVEVVGASMSRTRRDGWVVHTADDIADPVDWFATVVVRDDDAMVDRLVFYLDNGVLLQGWPGDEEWLAFTGDLVERGLPALREAIGRPWNQTGRLTIVETSAPYAYGYAGWYERSRSLIEIGDDLDPQVTLHEMAHAWFDEETFAERWLSEAFADEFAALAMAELGWDRPAPEPVTGDEPGALPLNDWADVDLLTPEAEEQEAYGYAASWWVARRLVEEIGVEGVAGVVGAAADRRSPYAVQGEPSSPDVADWRMVLDLAELVAGSTQAEPLFRDLVVADADLAALDARAAARVAYDGLTEVADGWPPPAALRDAMAAWRFEDVAGMVALVDALYGQRDAIAEDLARADVVVPASLQQEFQRSEDLAALEVVMDDAEDAAQALADATSALAAPGPLARLGLLLTDAEAQLDRALAGLEAGDFDLVAAAARDASGDVAGAARTGAVGLAVLLLLALALAVVVRRRTRTRTPDEPSPPAEASTPGLTAGQDSSPTGTGAASTLPV
ncbi:MAG: hypothetical protein H5T83_14280, partial [Actinotalea sp.]|nr:hypothetical protein [Actinotalea sp.]